MKSASLVITSYILDSNHHILWNRSPTALEEEQEQEEKEEEKKKKKRKKKKTKKKEKKKSKKQLLCVYPSPAFVIPSVIPKQC
ncbi:hypothetical protein M8J76_005968 [Diaphorina citri]|nr:hypothetical protein M8J76_005968 [Diaphorina citri]